MKFDRRELASALLPGVVLALSAAIGGVLFVAVLEPHERSAFVAMFEPRAALLLFAGLVLSGALGALSRWAYLRWIAAPARLAEQGQVLLLASDVQRDLPAVGSAETRALAAIINRFARDRDFLRARMAEEILKASRGVELERNRLAALMAELVQSVVVCNLDGRVLLYNARARAAFRALSAAPNAAGGADLIGLGRSIYTVLERRVVAHALESVQQRLQRGAVHPTAQFVTGTRTGQLLRVQMAPVRRTGADADPEALDGFVLMVDNITRDFAAESERDRLMQALTEGSRASLGNLQAAVEMLDYEDLDAATRERFFGVVREEVQAMSRRLRDLASHTAQAMKTRWPLEDMPGTDLFAVAARRIETLHGCRVDTDEVDPGLWLRVDSFSLLQALIYLAGRLVDEYGFKWLRLRLAAAGAHARLDLVWSGQAMSSETVASWETDEIRVGADTLALTVRDVVERHDGAFWFERERVRHECFFRLLLPMAAVGEQLEVPTVERGGGRPETYDFDLFRATDQARELADRRLADLVYTVFDTETTGLQPSAGDEIIQIGATRVVAGKVRREDCFEQLVDPRRDIAAESIEIHGITPEMVRGAPTIEQVLPTFHAFAQDTVLVGHNVAFDLRFLELKQSLTGLVFDQPVLDTLLLSAVVHPQQESHRLEALAERFGVPMLGRHTALGDAMVTAEVFLKLIPLLAERGIHTLGQARDAAQQTYFARVSY
jgi:DNA polymerase III subunit epsilon